MIVKGCCRKVIFVKDTGSKYIDSAYFILKSDLPHNICDRDMLREAERLIGSDAAPHTADAKDAAQPKKPRCDGLIAFSQARLQSERSPARYLLSRSCCIDKQKPS